MKICFLAQDPGVVYGAEQATLDLAEGLRNRGQEVVFLLIHETRCAGAGDSLASRANTAGFETDVVSTTRRFSPALISRLRSRIAALRPAVVHGYGAKALVHGGWAVGWGNRVPLIHTVHGWRRGGDRKEAFYDAMERRLLRRCNAVVSLSSFSRDLLLASGIPRKRIRFIPIVPNPSRVLAWVHPDSPRSPLVVGMLARFGSEKDHRSAVRALARLVDDGFSVRALLAGDGPLRPEVGTLVRRLDLDHLVSLPGYLAAAEFFESVDVLVHAAHLENRPFAVMEAMCRGQPVVATRVGGLPELVEDGDSGLLVEAGDAPALAVALSRLVRDPLERARLGANGRTALNAPTRFVEACDAHLALYRQMAATPSSR